MNDHDRRPPVGVGHIVLATDRMEESAQFIRTIGMRPIVTIAAVAKLAAILCIN